MFKRNNNSTVKRNYALEKEIYNKIMYIFHNIINSKLPKQQIEFFDEQIAEALKQYPNIGRIQDEYSSIIGMYCAQHQLHKATMQALEDPDASTILSMDGMNIGMYCATQNMEEECIKALQNSYAATQQDNHKMNIGMYAAKNELYNATLIALDNQVAAKQIDFEGKTIGIHAVDKGMLEATIKALKLELNNPSRYSTVLTLLSKAKSNGMDQILEIAFDKNLKDLSNLLKSSKTDNEEPTM